MGELERIADQLRRALDGDTWSGRSLGSIVGAVPAGRAAERPANGGNTAWQLLAHIGCWLDVARIRFEGAAHDPAPGGHMPAPVDDLTEAAWGEAWAVVKRRGEALAAAIERADDSRLDARTPGRDYTNYHLLHGVIQHTLYHAGQIALLARD